MDCSMQVAQTAYECRMPESELGYEIMMAAIIVSRYGDTLFGVHFSREKFVGEENK